MTDFASMLRGAAASPGGRALSAVFAEEPVSLSVFVEDKKFLANPPLSPVQFEAVQHIERIYYADLYPLMAQEFSTNRKPDTLHVGYKTAWRDGENYWATPIRMINFATLQWGKGAGKDHIARVSSLRIAYLLLCLDSPQHYYGMPEQDTIHLLNVASTSGQAQRAFFTPMTDAVKRGWFADKCVPHMNSITFAKNVEAVSGHSDAESQEGLNLLLGIADEIDAFKSAKELVARRATAREPTKTAESILKMMRTSGATRFPELYKQVRISYPRYLGSMIQRLTDDARKDFTANPKTSRHYVSGPLATWEVNPRVTGRDQFEEDYKEDPLMARSMYECRPSHQINPYYRNVQQIDSCFRQTAQLPLTVHYALEEQTGKKVWAPRYEFAPDFQPVRGAIYAMHGDLAVQGDRAGIGMAHVVNWTEQQGLAEDEDGALHVVPEMRPNIKVDFIISYSSDKSASPPREIQIRWARQLCFELIRRGFNIKLFTFDTFQSADSMQILEAKGIECKKQSTDISEDPWRNLRDLLYESRVTIPAPIREDPDKPWTNFLLRDELLSLTRFPNGRINHPPNGSKDEVDALAGCVLGAITLGGAEEDGAPAAIYAPADFHVGKIFDLPFGVHPKGIWETEIPTPF